MTTPKRAAGLVSLATVLAGCAASSAAPVSVPAGAQHVTIDGNDHMRFVPDRVVVHPGVVVVTLHDVGSEAHNIDFPQLHVKSALIPGGGTTSVTLHVLAGHTYDFDCDIHISEGMVGTLVVSRGNSGSASKGSQ